ncbi:MAG TPA: ATP-binding protein [Ignavibacteriales bacterium]|nr:ATP-binding protein [Ignavibacteriales bacterium]
MVKFSFKYLCVIFIFFILSNNSLFAQKDFIIDSILISTINKPIDERIDHIAKTAWSLRGKAPETALKLLYTTIDLAEKNDYENKLAPIYNYIGIIYRNLGNYGFAQNSFFKALELARKYNLKIEEGYAYNNIGEILYLVSNYKDSYSYLKNAEKIFSALDNLRGLGYVYNQLGLYYYENNNYRTSINYLLLSLKFRQKLQDTLNIAVTYRNLVNSYLKINNLDSTILLLANLKYLAEKINSPRMQIDTYEAFANYYFQINKHEIAISYAQKALLEAQNIYYWKGVKNLSAFLYRFYENQKDYYNSFHYLKIYVSANDTLLNQNSLKDIYNYISQYNYLKDAYYQDKLNFYQKAITFIVIFFVLSLAILLFFISKFKKQILTQKSVIIELENKIDDLNNTYEENLKAKDKYLSIIAHDLKNPISAIKNISEVMINQNQRFSEREIYDNLHLIKNTSNSLFNLLMDLLDWARANTGQIELHPAIINVETLVNDVLNYLSLQANNKHISIIVDIEDNLHIYADYNTINTVLRNIISNAIKFTPIGGKIIIKCKSDMHNSIISITDTGIGIPEEKIPKLFEFEKNRSTTGTSGETGTGLGLILCKDFVEKNNGTISVQSELNKGTTFTITLPTNKI